MFFVLNGHPSRIYRCLLNPTKIIDFDILLEEVSRGLEVKFLSQFLKGPVRPETFLLPGRKNASK